ncbi:MAG: phosphatidate cytidylyltransferase [Acidobacteriaceae bacterium]|nr:phosphatidate cytidylyltransferase [Acidobacteriaceae bacterium]
MKRVLTAIALIALAVYLIWFAAPWGFEIAALCLGLLCFWEYSGLVAAHGIRGPRLFGVLAGLLIVLLPDRLLPGVPVIVICAFVWALRLANLRDILPAVACEFLGSFYAFAPWRFAIDLRAASIHLLFFALAINWIGDSAAYYAGRLFGRHRLAPIVSPKKSWEGSAASVAASTLFGVLYLGHFVPRLPWWQIALMAILGNIAGQFGDLTESAIKRGAGVKDSGNLLPGHGGVLDRMDSSLFALPVVYFLLNLFSLLRHH